jgi:hypothetical protein
MVTYVKFYCQSLSLFQKVSTFKILFSMLLTSTKYVNLLLLRGNVKKGSITFMYKVIYL